MQYILCVQEIKDLKILIENFFQELNNEVLINRVPELESKYGSLYTGIWFIYNAIELLFVADTKKNFEKLQEKLIQAHRRIFIEKFV